MRVMALCQGPYCIYRTKGNRRFGKAVIHPCIILGTTSKRAHYVHG